MTKRLALSAAAIIAVGLLIAACGGGGSTHLTCPGGERTPHSAAAPTATPASGSWPNANADLANTRDASGSAISSANVSRLEPAWTFKLTGPGAAGVAMAGSLSAAPIVQDGVVYVQDLDSNVYALALATGRVKWECQFNAPVQIGPGPNGVSVADGVVYGDTPTSAFALSAATGKPLWIGRKLLAPGQGTFSIQPQVADGRVYLASGYGTGPGGGVLLALNASTGRPLWRFSTIIQPAQGVQALGAGAGGAWQTPLVSPDGSVTYGIGNPYQSAAAAIAHPSRLLYSDSAVNLDAASGKLRWYYQAVPDDFRDWDMQASPISTQSQGRPVVLGAGKMGYVYAMDARTGKLIWKTPVGQHNGHDNDSVLALEHKSRLKAPYKLLPGTAGGVLTNMALAGDHVYVVICNWPFTLASLADIEGTASFKQAFGEVESLDLATGKVQWKTKVPDLPLGAATVSNDLVFTTLYRGALIALNRQTGAIVYQRKLPTSANSPIAVAGHTMIVPAGGPGSKPSKDPQLAAYTVP